MCHKQWGVADVKQRPLGSSRLTKSVGWLTTVFLCFELRRHEGLQRDILAVALPGRASSIFRDLEQFEQFRACRLYNNASKHQFFAPSGKVRLWSRSR